MMEPVAGSGHDRWWVIGGARWWVWWVWRVVSFKKVLWGHACTIPVHVGRKRIDGQYVRQVWMKLKVGVWWWVQWIGRRLISGMTYLLCDWQLITCNHLNTNSKVKCPADGLSTVMPWRIKQGQQPTKCPRTSRTFFSLFWNLLICNPKRS